MAGQPVAQDVLGQRDMEGTGHKRESSCIAAACKCEGGLAPATR